MLLYIILFYHSRKILIYQAFLINICLIFPKRYLYIVYKKEMPQFRHLFSFILIGGLDLVFGGLNGDYSSQTEEISPQFLQIEWKYTWSFPSASVSS